MIEWKPIKSTKRLSIGDIVFYKSETQEFLAKVRFTSDNNYLVISPYSNPAVGIVVLYLSYIFTPHETL